MLDIDKLTKIGFGTHRASINQIEHEESLRAALKNGCNLIDTSSNYRNGESEKLIGKVLSEGYSAFVITKAGYITKDNLISYNASEKKFDKEVISISDSFKYSIHPEYLERQINKSLLNLKRKRIDCFMLHNPEYCYVDSTISNKEYYNRIKKTFIFLEGLVKEKKIRFYGVSSNFHFPSNNLSITRLDTLIEIANNISEKNHFKFIQYPNNLFEKEANKPFYSENRSLSDLAKLKGILRLGNRPFTTKDNFGNNIRIIPHRNIPLVDEKKIESNINKLLSYLEIQLKKTSPKDSLKDFIIFEFPKKWSYINRIEDVDAIFNTLINPFIDFIYSNEVSKEIKILLNTIFTSMHHYVQLKENKLTMALFKENYPELLEKVDENNFSEYLIKKHLISDEIDFMLVGMRKLNHVDSIKNLLKK